MITKKILREWGACWTDEQIDELANGRKSMTLREIAKHPDIPYSDRTWVLCRAMFHLDPRAARLFAVETALTVVHLAGEWEDELRGILNDLIESEDLPEEERSAAADAAANAAYAARVDAAAAYAAADAAAHAAASAAYAAASAAYAAASAAVNAASAAANAAADAAANAAYAAYAAAYAARAASWEDTLKRALEWLGAYADRRRL